MLHAASDSTDVANKRDHPKGSLATKDEIENTKYIVSK